MNKEFAIKVLSQYLGIPVLDKDGKRVTDRVDSSDVTLKEAVYFALQELKVGVDIVSTVVPTILVPPLRKDTPVVSPIGPPVVKSSK